MTTTTTTTSLTIRRHLKASLDRVWRAFSDLAEARQWSAPEGMECTMFEADMRVGGRYRLQMHGPDGDHTATGVYKEIAPKKKLVYTWRWEGNDNPEGTITIEFAAKDGGTELVLTHDGLVDATDVANHRQGWESCVEKLARLVVA